MTKNDYVKIADAFHAIKPTTPDEARMFLKCVDGVSLAMKRDNPKFQRNIFLHAVGVDDVIITVPKQA